MQTPKISRTRMSEAFYGRRKGKPLRENQIKRQSDLLPQLLINVQQPAPASIKSLFAKPVDGVRLEIGFGGGEHLLHEAQRFNNTGFIGVEPFVNGMAKLLNRVEALDDLQASLRLYNDDATVLLDWLPDQSLDGIDLFYPDPWPKKKHWKRRFVNQKNLQRFARVLKKGALFRFASDIDTYINWTLLHCRDSGHFEWLANNASDWYTPYEAWPGTRYEAKAIRENRTPCYLTFRHI